MATFYTNPAISFQGLRQPENPSELLTRFAQLKQMGQERQMNDLRMKEGNLRLAELQRMANEGAATRNAYGAAVTPGTAGGPPTFDRNKMLQDLASNPQNAYLVPQAQAGFATQDAAQKEEHLKLAKEAEALTDEQLKNAKARADMIGSLAQSIIINPASYPVAKATAEKMGLVQPGKLPEQLTPDLLPQLHALASQSVAVKDTLTLEETNRHNKAMEQAKGTAGSPHTTDFGGFHWQYDPKGNLPGTRQGDWVRLGVSNRQADGELTPAQKLARSKAFSQAEREKGAELRRAEVDIRKRYGLGYGETGMAATEQWPPEAIADLEDAKQRVQDEYESKLGNLGADVSHFDYSSQRGSPTSQRGGAGTPGKFLDTRNPEHRRIAAEILQQAGGDVNKARQIAKQRGYAF